VYLEQGEDLVEDIECDSEVRGSVDKSEGEKNETGLADWKAGTTTYVHSTSRKQPVVSVRASYMVVWLRSYSATRGNILVRGRPCF
jgi:hypothetical protein